MRKARPCKHILPTYHMCRDIDMQETGVLVSYCYVVSVLLDFSECIPDNAFMYVLVWAP